jgi:two-component system OmpR family response regulator
VVQLVLLDRRLPDMDGLALCRQIRAALGATIPILLLTADREPTLAAAAEEAGATAYLSKPVDPDLLLGRVISLLS